MLSTHFLLQILQSKMYFVTFIVKIIFVSDINLYFIKFKTDKIKTQHAD